jgi:hypothetical protein
MELTRPLVDPVYDRRRKAREDELKKIQRDVGQLLQHPKAPVVFRMILELCPPNSAPCLLDPYAAAYENGRRSVTSAILDMIAACAPDLRARVLGWDPEHGEPKR